MLLGFTMFYWLFEICQANSYILFCLSQKADSRRLSLKEYKQALVRQLSQHVIIVDEIRSCGRRQETSCMEKTNNIQHLVDYSKRDRDCVFCSTSTKRARTHFLCSGFEAQPHLHPKGCFKSFHEAQ